MIKLKNVLYTYALGTPFEKTALTGLNIEIKEGEFIAVAGRTGSGKSTLIQLISGLITPTSGVVSVDEVDLQSRNKLEALMARRKVGIVFQYPEEQLFEQTVEADVGFAPINLGCSAEEVSERVKASLDRVGLDYDKYRLKEPHNLSGGQKRRVAIAGVLAMNPKYLILDEPTAGLDPKARRELMQMTKKLHSGGVTVIMVSHNMDEIAGFAKRLIVLSKGKLIVDATPREVFANAEILTAAGLKKPTAAQVLTELKTAGVDIDTNVLTIDEAEEQIRNAARHNAGAVLPWKVSSTQIRPAC